MALVLKLIYMKKKKIQKYLTYVLVGCVLLVSYTSRGQSGNLTANDLRYQNTIANLAKYLANTQELSINRDSLKNYIYFDYTSENATKTQRQKRLQSTDTLIKILKHFVDSIGYANIDVKPVQDFKSNTDYYQPFETELKNDAPNSLAYYNKSSPSLPLGSLLFDPKTGKLISWIIINQSGYHYFLTLDML
jgi:hypothetical protein